MPPSDGLLHEPLERTFGQHGFPMPADYVEALSVQFVLAYLQQTDAVATMTRDIAHHYRQQGLVSVLPFNFPKLMRTLGITWNRDRAMSPSTALLITCLEEAAASGAPA